MSYTETKTTVGLTKDDLNAFRKADRVSFHFVDGEHTIVCTKRLKKPDSEHYHRVQCDGSVRCYKTDSTDYTGKKYECFTMPFYGQSEEWQTIVQSLKVGDRLSLEWVGNDTNQYERKAVSGDGERLFHDRLYLIARRGDKTFKWYVDDSVCPDNTARMIRQVI